MSLLSRYLLRQNLFLLMTILLLGVGLYILTDMFERLDNFLESGIAAGTVVIYFLVKIPTVISLILPAVFMLSLVAQMNILRRSRELVALESGGISPLAITRFVIVYGLVWAFLQLGFSQGIGVMGERMASRIWQEEVRGNILEEVGVTGIWFTEGRHIIHIGTAYPARKCGDDVLVYTLDESGVGIDEIIKAKRFVVTSDGAWTLENGERLVPAEYTATPFERFELGISQDLESFRVRAQLGIKPSQLTLPELHDTISRLERAGSNVEGLRTVWHSKLASAVSMIIMGMMALMVSRLTGNIYKATVLTIVVVFFYYGANAICQTMGEKGFLSPPVGAWFTNAFFLLLGFIWQTAPALMRRLRT